MSIKELNHSTAEKDPYKCTKVAIHVEKEDREKVEQLLDDNKVGFRSYDTPLEGFYFEEAKWRIHTGYDTSKATEEEINELADEISDEFFDSDSVLDYEELDKIVRENIFPEED